jgi:hypothetical protein
VKQSPCLDCGTPTTNGARCPEHDTEQAHRVAKTRQHGVKRAHFQALRTQRLELAGHRCELRVDALCTGTATTVHIRPELDGNHDAATLNDCLAGCAHCHGVIDAGRAHGRGGGSRHLHDAHSPVKGSKNPRTGGERAGKRSDGVVFA